MNPSDDEAQMRELEDEAERQYLRIVKSRRRDGEIGAGLYVLIPDFASEAAAWNLLARNRGGDRDTVDAVLHYWDVREAPYGVTAPDRTVFPRNRAVVTRDDVYGNRVVVADNPPRTLLGATNPGAVMPNAYVDVRRWFD